MSRWKMPSESLNFGKAKIHLGKQPNDQRRQMLRNCLYELASELGTNQGAKPLTTSALPAEPGKADRCLLNAESRKRTLEYLE